MGQLPILCVMCSCPSGHEKALAQKIIQHKLAACVQIIPAVTSLYKWDGALQEAQESILWMKTPSTLYSKLEAFIEEHHPYDCPEVVAIPISQGLPRYLTWVSSLEHS